MKSKAHKGKSGGSDPAAGAPPEELPERWSVQRKTELVLRLVRGESLDAVLRENQVPAHELEQWHGVFVARGLVLRCDWGPQYIADAWINEVKWLGCTISPSYVGEPECNGVAERFMRTLKEQCIYLHQFRSLEEARQVIADFIARYNTQWLIERLGYRTPAQARAEAQQRAA